MNKVKFNLDVGMSPAEIRNELGGKISGETRGETALIFRKEDSLKINNEPDLVVEKVDKIREYALMSKQSYDQWSEGWDEKAKHDILKEGIRKHSYLVGISDEGMYFAHELDTREFARGGSPQEMNLEDLVAWVNRADDGFCRRVQGDILIQYQAPPLVIVEVRQYGMNSADYIIYTAGLGTFNFRMHDRPQRMISLGNHKISSDGVIWQAGHVVIVVGASTLLVQHPEHGEVREQIPKDHIVLLAGQRGRNLAGYD